MATQLALVTKNDLAGTSVADAHFDQPGKRSPRTAMNAALSAVNGLISGIATIPLGADTVTVSAATLAALVPGLHGGSPVQLTINEAAEDGTLFRLRYTWSTDDLVIDGNANATADVDVRFSVDTRA